jgi:hypothetical protein
MFAVTFKRWCYLSAACALYAVSASAQAPVLSTPTNGSTNVAVPLTLTWESEGFGRGGADYAVQVATASTFAATVLGSTGLTGNSLAVTGLAAGTTYYWRAGEVGFATTWSTAWHFTTATGTATGTAPVLNTPSAGKVGLGTTVTFSWGSVAKATSYTLQIDSTIDFSSVLYTVSGISSTSKTYAGLSENTTYFWRVEAVETGTTSPWSSVGWFTVSPSATISHTALSAEPVFSLRNGAVAYSVTRASPVAITLFDMRGKAVLAFSRMQAAGRYSFNLANHNLPAGLYALRFSAGSFEKRTVVSLVGNR